VSNNIKLNSKGYFHSKYLQLSSSLAQHTHTCICTHLHVIAWMSQTKANTCIHTSMIRRTKFFNENKLDCNRFCISLDIAYSIQEKKGGRD
jgi:hypothetical protein